MCGIARKASASTTITACHRSGRGWSAGRTLCAEASCRQARGFVSYRLTFIYGWTHMNEPAFLVQSGPRFGYSPGASRMVSPVKPWSLKKSQVPDFTFTDAI